MIFARRFAEWLGPDSHCRFVGDRVEIEPKINHERRGLIVARTCRNVSAVDDISRFSRRPRLAEL